VITESAPIAITKSWPTRRTVGSRRAS